MAANREIRILPNAEAIAECAAAEFLKAGDEAVREKGVFCVALAGGSTPKALYTLLSKNPVLRADPTAANMLTAKAKAAV
jgi:6-phosphogluconolactonase